MTTEILISLLTLIVLEIVLGIDNIIFISILSDKLLPKIVKKQDW
jgi:predicted tellurium resistance membrane protein TerC